MQTRYALSIKGTTHYYATLEEATKMAKFCGINVTSIKTVDLW